VARGTCRSPPARCKCEGAPSLLAALLILPAERDGSHFPVERRHGNDVPPAGDQTHGFTSYQPYDARVRAAGAGVIPAERRADGLELLDDLVTEDVAPAIVTPLPFDRQPLHENA
jgi:hypothetical protein